MFNQSNKEDVIMAVMSKPKFIIPVLSEENSKKVLSMPINKKVINQMLNTSNKFRKGYEKNN